MTLIKNNPNMASGWEPYLQISHYKGFNYNVWEKEPTLRGSLIDKVYNNLGQILLAIPNKELTDMNIEVLNSIKSYAGGKNISIRIVVIH